SEVQPGLGERRAGTRIPYPSGEREAGRSWLIQLALPDRPRAAHDFPGVCRALRRMNHDRAGGTLPSGFLELVGPPPVVREDLAEEYCGVHEPRIIHQHQQDFAVQVDALVVVPLPLGRANAVANEDDVAGCRDVRFGSFRPCDECVAIWETIRRAPRFAPAKGGFG